jgi:predicted permease
MRFGFRQLRKSPCFTAIAVLSLALGIGANTAIFSLINGILLKSLPVRNPDELRLINWTSYKWPNRPGLEGHIGRTKDNTQFYCGAVPYPAYREFAKQTEGFSDLFAFSSSEYTKTINVNDAATLASAQSVSGNFFKSYGARILIGRPITPEDDRPDASPVVVLTYRFWQRIFGLDPHVIGRTLLVGKSGFTIIGVLPRGYVSPMVGETRTDFYVPIAAQPRLMGGNEDWLSSYNIWWVQMMGRLAPGANEARMKSSFELWFSHVVNRSNVKLEQYGIWLQEGRRGALGNREETAEPLWNLMGIVGLVLLIACTNLAGLLLARGAARQHEMAVRAAMGAGRWRLIRQSLTESLILSLAGVCLGLIFSLWIRAALAGFIIDPSSNKQFNLQVDANVLIFALAVGVLATLLSGLFPALRAANTNPSAGLKDTGTRAAPRLRLGKVLVTAQVGLSVIVVVLGGLLCRTLINLYRVKTGFDMENILLVTIEPGQSLSPVKNREALLQAICQKIREIPGVQSAALSNRSMLEGSWWNREISIPGRSDEEKRECMALVVSEGYFKTMGIKLFQGRDFRTTDTRNSQGVAIVNEEFVREFFPNETPLGQFITVDGEQHQIVGLCSNQKYDRLRRDISPILYMPHLQNRFFHLTCAIRSVLPPMSLVPAVRKAVAEVDPRLPLEGITTQKLVIKKALARERLFASLSGSLAILALALSCIGLYGLMAYNVTRRTGEMGIRKALGARPWDVARPILREALTLAAIGVIVGSALALALVRMIQSILYGIAPYDPLTMIGAAMLMVTVAFLAAWIPARRAAKIDPMVALRYE